jgi:IucA / IucC family/Ferric iron reductase FhuF-like transporter
MQLAEVRRWARGRRISVSRFRQAYDGALLHAIARLLQAIYRESRVTRLSQDDRGRWHLDIGRKFILRAPVSGPLPFRRLETIGSPWILTAGTRRRIRTADRFLDALGRCLAGTEYDSVLPALRTDFENSVANVVLNRLIGGALGAKARAIEPAYQGHQYYPFPALRIGPDLSQVLECSHLCREPVELPLLRIGSCRLISCLFDSHAACLRAWSGLETPSRSDALMPLHPWQGHLSPVVRELSARKLVTVSRHTIEAIPLASQRTCRIVRTGFDLKLSIDATLTGERRLLHQLNCENAPIVSVLAKQLLDENGKAQLDFQEDLASICHGEPAIAPHLSAIIRAPVRALPGEVVIPAINLWSGKQEFRRLLRSADRARVEEFFQYYCRALMTGPVAFWSQWGMGFEPHLQNVYVGLRDGLPSRIILRDLDASILDPRRTRPALRKLGLDLPKETWQVMPAVETGGKRLVQAMLFGHLGEVMWCLTQGGHSETARLAAIVDDTWSELAAHAPSASARRSVNRLRGWSNAVKATLRTRLHRTTRLEFVRE